MVGRLFGHSILLAAALMAAWQAPKSRTAAQSGGVSKSMLSYEAFPEQEDYIQHQKIRLRMRIQNHGPDMVEIPDPQEPASDQPTISLSGPEFPQGMHFSNLSVLRDQSGEPEFVVPAPAVIRIQPGATWEGFAPITPIVQILEPGEYGVHSVLAYQGKRVESKEQKFRVQAVSPSSIQIGVGPEPHRAASGEVVFIQRGDRSAVVYAQRFDEGGPDSSEMIQEPPIHRATVTAAATDVAVPARNGPYFGELLNWIVWREGRSIKALSSVMSKPLSADITSQVAFLVHPPLKTTGGPVEVLAVSDNRQEISLVEFSSGPVGQDPAARRVWQARLPAATIGMTAALAPLSQQSARHVLLTVQRGSGFEIFHSRYSAAGLEAFQSVAAGRGKLLASAAPALFIDGEGHAKVAVLAEPDGGAHSCILAEAEFDISGKPTGAARLSEFGLEGRPVGGAVLYSQKQGSALHLDVVVAVDGHGLLHLDETGHLIPVSVPGRPTSPILLAPGTDATFLLYTDPKRGLYFEAM